MDIACSVKGCQLSEETRARNAFVDVASIVRQTLPGGAGSVPCETNAVLDVVAQV